MTIRHQTSGVSLYSVNNAFILQQDLAYVTSQNCMCLVCTYKKHMFTCKTCKRVVRYEKYDMAPYRAVALYTFSMEQVQNCMIKTVTHHFSHVHVFGYRNSTNSRDCEPYHVRIPFKYQYDFSLLSGGIHM